MSLHVINDDELAALTDENRVIAYFAPASPAGVEMVLDTPLDDDGHSEWRWVRLIDGSLILGVYPHGETYFAIENIVHEDFNEATP